MPRKKKAGRLIVFEGCDNVGKSTIMKSFAKRLELTKTPFVQLAFPGHETGSVGKWVYDFHHDPGKQDADKTCLQMLHVAAHIDCIQSRIKPLLEKGHWVILDRFWWSTWVYGVIGGVDKIHLRQMIKIETDFWGAQKPDCLFFIRRKVAVQNDQSKMLSNEYEKLSRRERKKHLVVEINNEGSVDETVDSITEQLAAAGIKALKNKTGWPTRKRMAKSTSKRSAAKKNGLAPLEPTKVYDTYWEFAVARQEIFFRRISGQLLLTTDPILSEYKFTNAFRAADRVSQYLIKNVIYAGCASRDEVFFRIILFKIFNRISTWELLLSKLGCVQFSDYSFTTYDRILTEAIEGRQRIYSAAYIMPSGGRNSEFDKKHRMHLKLIEQMMEDGLPRKIAECNSMSEGFSMLRAYPTLGDFLAYQYITDINYSELTDFSEMEFVVPGPGARNGIAKCFSNFGGLNDTEIIQIVTKRQDEEFKMRGLNFQNLFGRKLQLIDCQNLFCEVDKYARVKHPEFSGTTGRKRIKQKFHMNQEPIEYWFPPKWKINNEIKKGSLDASII